MIENNGCCFCPSFEFERKTKAFNRYIWFFVSMASMFTVGVGIFAFIACTHDIFNLAYSFLHDHLVWVTLVPVIVFILTMFQGIQFLMALMTSYCLEDGKIVRGKIQDCAMDVSLTDLTTDVVTFGKMLQNISNPKKVNAIVTAQRLEKICRLISLNMHVDFASANFNTKCYKKKEFLNPRLIRETRYSWIFTCDNKKRLLIPKLYLGTGRMPLIHAFSIRETVAKVNFPQKQKERSFVGRIFIRIGLVFVACLLIAVIDLFAAVSNNAVYMEDISDTLSNIELNLAQYGYKKYTSSPTHVGFEKKIGNNDRTSYVQYVLDRKGNLERVEVQLYYGRTSNHVEEELTYIISTLEKEFDPLEIEEFIDMAMESLEGERKYGSLKSGEFRLLLQTSGEYIDIHSY